MNRSTSSAALAVIILSFFLSVQAAAQEFSAKSLADYGNVTVMEVSGSYDAKNPDGTVNSAPRQAIATEFFRTHKDEYDFLVVISNFDFTMPDDGHAKAFYMGVKSDTHNIGITEFNRSQDFGSTNEKLQGMVDMGNLGGLATDPMDPKFNETLYLLSHEMMHRWGAHAKFRTADGSDSTALLGKDHDHWSFLFDSGGSVLYGNRWQNNGNGTFTSLAPPNELKLYSPLDLYLMGMIDRSKVPPMLLIESPGIDPGRLPEAGVTIPGTARTVTIDDIIAALRPRVPDASASQKSFKTAFIYVTQPGTFTPDAIYSIENIRNGFVTRHSILTDGQSIVQVAATSKDDIPANSGILPPSTTPRTSPASISEGVQWLRTNQKSDGSWADLPGTEERDTAEAVLALRNFLDAQSNYGSGLQRLALSTSGNTDFLSRKLEAYAAAGQDVSALVTDLLARRNSDGGWGGDRLYQSNPADTALALKALALAGYEDRNIIAPAIVYLTARQNTSDGGWGPDDNSSTLQFTAAVLSAFNKYRGYYQLEDPISRGMGLIASHQNKDTDKGFGNSPSTVYDTATAVLVLRELGASTEITNNGLDYIRGRQSGDGSWNESAFQTAIAIDAIYKATVDPDLSIKTADIHFIPTTITSLPTNVVIEAKIWNLGQTAVPEATVALYRDSVTEASRITEQTIAFPGQQATTVTFSTTISSGNGHRFFLVVDPANLVKESSKANNSAAAVIAAEETYDLDVLPQDITLSQSDVTMFSDVVITATIRNKGTMTAYNVPVQYFIDEANAPFNIATLTIDSIPASGAVTRQFTWRANKAGMNMPLTLSVDPFNTFTELSKMNNKATTAVTVYADTRPNITVSYKDIVASPGTIQQGGNATISALVKNDGFSTANAVNVSIWSVVTGTIGAQTIAALAQGESKQVVVDWTNIPVSGDQTIYVRTVSAGPEIRTDDNESFITLNILSLPDLAISANSITFSPAAPKDGDTVTIVATIQNEGEQGAQNVVVNVFEGSALVGTGKIAEIPGLLSSTATFTYNTAGKQGNHEITVIIDPENIDTEQNRSNNRATRSLIIQNANLWLTERYFSPNGDGVKDSTEFFFRLPSPQTVTISVADPRGETVRTFSGAGLQNVDSAAIAWDGLDDTGKLVDDGTYQMQLRDAANKMLSSLPVTVDTNRSPLSEAFGTKYLLKNNMTCPLPYIDTAYWQWLPDESGILFLSQGNPDIPAYPYGLYIMGPDGGDIRRIDPLPATTADEPNVYYDILARALSPDGEMIALIIRKIRWTQSSWGRVDTVEYHQLLVGDREGKAWSMIASSTGDTSILDVQWFPSGGRLIYRLQSGAAPEQLLTISSSGGALPEPLDSGGFFDFNYIKWSPDGRALAYVKGVYDEQNNYLEYIRTANLSGAATTVFTVNDAEHQYHVDYLAWLSSHKILMHSYLSQDDQPFWIIDSSGSRSSIRIPYTTFSDDIAISPDRSAFSFTSSTWQWGASSGTISTYVSDEQGAVTKLYDHLSDGTNCEPRQSSVIWSPDGKMIAMSTEVVKMNDSPGPCGHAVPSTLIVIDRRTGLAQSTAVTMQPLAWMADSDSIAGLIQQSTTDASNRICLFNTATGSLRCDSLPAYTSAADDRSQVLSPRERYLTYYQHKTLGSTCASTGDDDIWSMSSLLNLTADLRVIREKEAFILKGIASDINFDSYQLDYAAASNPGDWRPLTPPSNMPVANDIFTTWVPPSEGMFLVRLTVRDQAGNTSVDVKRVLWDRLSAVTNLSLSRKFFNPNVNVGGVNSTVELNFRVNASAHLEVTILDSADRVVRTIIQEQTTLGNGVISWDGTDEHGAVVPDGKYSIKIQDMVFPVVADAATPVVSLHLTPMKSMEPAIVNANLLIAATDANMQRWRAEYGFGDSPTEWFEFAAGSNSTALPSILLATMNVFGNPSLTDATFRLTAEDGAGNSSTTAPGRMPEGMILLQYDGEYLVYRSDEELQLASGNKELLLLKQGRHSFELASVLRHPTVSWTVQYSQDPRYDTRPDGTVTRIWDQWKEIAVEAQATSNGMLLHWQSPAIDPSKPCAMRVKAVDGAGLEHYTDYIVVQNVFTVEQVCADAASKATAFTGNDYYFAGTLQKIRFQSAKAMDGIPIAVLSWYDVQFTAGSTGALLQSLSRTDTRSPLGQFVIQVPFDQITRGNGQSMNGQYYVHMVGTDEKGGEYVSEPVLIETNYTFDKKYVFHVINAKDPVTTECDQLSDGKIPVRAALFSRETSEEVPAYALPIKILSTSYYSVRGGADQLIETVQNNFGRTTIDLLSSASTTVRARVAYENWCGRRTWDDDLVLTLDRDLPKVAIDFPEPGTTVCALTDGAVTAISVKARISDDSSPAYYYAFYSAVTDSVSGKGDIALKYDRISKKTLPFFGEGAVDALWDITNLEGSSYSLRLEAVDNVGNKTCATTRFTISGRIKLSSPLVDHAVFSPDGDGYLDEVKIGLDVDAFTNINVNIVRLTTMDLTDAIPVRNLVTGGRFESGKGEVSWNGRDDTGDIVPDGRYAVVLSVRGPCEHNPQSWTSIEVDTTPPTASIVFPRQGDSFGAVVEVRGTASDQHFLEFILEAGQGDEPTAWMRLSEKTIPVYDSALGIWNNFGMEGRWTIRLTARDAQKHVSTATVKLDIGARPTLISFLTAMPGLISPTNGDGVLDQTTVSFGFQEACTAYMEILDPAGALVKTFTINTLSAGTFENFWDGKDSRGAFVPDGRYTVRLTATTAYASSVEAVTIVVDNTAPSVAITSPKEGDYIKAPADITGTADDQNYDTYILDLSEGKCESAYKWGRIHAGTKPVQNGVLMPWKALPQDGEYCLKLTAMDKGGNKAEAKVNCLIDTHPPAAPTLAGTVENKTDVRLAWPQNAEPDVAGYNLYRNNQKMNSSLIAELNRLDQGLAEGVFTYTLKAVDRAGWESVLSNEVKLKIDVTGPSARIRSPQDGGTVVGLIDIKGTAYSADDFKQYRVYVGQGVAPSTWTLIRTSPLLVSYGVLAQWDTLGLAEGQVYSIKLEAEDTSGNITAHRVTVAIDNIPPAKPIIISAAGADTTATVIWNTNAEPDLAGYLLYRNGQLANVSGIVVGDLKPYLIAPGAGTTVYLDKALPDGTFNYYVVAMDKAGNEGPSSDIRVVTIETRPPHAVITEPLNAAQIGGKVLVNAASADLDIAEVTFEFKMASGDWLPFGTKVTSHPYVTYFDPAALNLGHGDYQLRVKATDKNQNKESDSALSAITVTYKDLTPPAAPDDLAAHVNGNTVMLTWKANKETDLSGYNAYRTSGTVRKKINSKVIAASDTPTHLDSPTANGTYIYEITAVDISGNESNPSSASALIYRPLLAWPKSPTSQRTVQLTGSNAAAGAVVELISPASDGTVRATTTADAAGRFQFEAVLADGSNSFAVRSTDSSGNVSRLSSPIWITRLPGPDAPTGLTAAEIPEGGALRLTWDAAAGTPAGYNLYRSDTKGGPYNKVNSGLLTKREYFDLNLTNGKSYYYVVATVGAQSIEGGYSLEVNSVSRDSIAPGKPYIDTPVRSGATATVFSSVADITGRAEKDAAVELFENGVSRGKAIASGIPDEQSYQFPENVHSTVLSPDERTVAYSIWRELSGEVWLWSLETGAHTRISTNGSWPVWSPDGSKLLYTSYDGNQSQAIWVYTVAESSATLLTGDGNVDEYEPVWSPDASKIAFTSNRITGTYGIWMKNLATGALNQLANIDESYSPIFSPDGRKLAYFENSNVIVLDLASMSTTVVEDNSERGALSWSPDSSELSLISYRNGYGDVYTYSLANQKWVQVTNLESEALYYDYAVWSPDGTRLVLAKGDDGSGSYTLEVGRTHIPGQVEVLQSGIDMSGVERTGSGYISYSDGAAIHKISLDGKFEFNGVVLDRGTTVLTVNASDASDNMSSPSDAITIMLDDSQLPDLTVPSDEVYLYPPYPVAGEQMVVNAVVQNDGAMDAHDVDVLVYLWNERNELELLKTERIPLITAQSAEMVSAVWDSTGKAGANRIVVVVDIDDRIVERDETNNMAIKDFSVADHEGISLTTIPDAAAYGSYKNVAVIVTARNSGPDKNAVLETRIEDGNGYPVATFDPRTVAVNYASDSVQAYTWNTGATFAATYSVHTLLKEGTNVLAENTAPFVILPNKATKANLVTDKAAYGANETISIVATIGNEGSNWIIQTLQMKMTVKDAAGNVQFNEEKSVINLLPGIELSHATTWNTGLSTAGYYSATLEVTTEGTTPTIKTAAFTIREAAVVTGTLSISPDAVSLGGSFQATYTLANSGNADTAPFMAQIVVIDPDTLSILDAHEEQMVVARSGSHAGHAVISTARYGLKKYTVLLRLADGNGTGVLASASMTVKDMTVPTMTVLSPVAGTPYTSTVSFMVAASDDASGVDRIEYSRDDGSWSLLPISDPARDRFGTTWDPTMADNGMHTVIFRAVDRSGNRSEEIMISYEVRINRAPTAPSPAWPATGQDVGTVRPELAVNNASDPNGDHLSYKFEIYADSDLSIMITPSGGIPEGTGTTAWIVPMDLTENAVYYWRAQAFDGKLYGPWTDTASFRVNAVEDPPSVPTPNSPPDKTEVATLTPVLMVINAVDPDSTFLTYNFQVALDPAFVTIVTSIEGVIGGDGKTSWQMPVPLAEDVRYYWRSQADDWTVIGNWSSPVEFFVNTGNNRPTDPSVIAPTKDSEVMTTSPDIVLQNSTDLDSSVITYSIEVDIVPTFNSGSIIRSGVISAGPGTTTWHAAGLLDNTTYYVQAMASDGSTSSNWTQTSFFVNTANDAPEKPIPANPSNGAGVNVFTPTLSVQNATDIDRDTLTYDFEVYKDAALTLPAASVAGVDEMPGTTSWTVSATLQENRTYYWRARAFDGELASGWTTTLSFTVNTGDEPPDAPKIVSPAEGGSVDSAMPTLTVLNSIDPDSTRLAYDFEVFYGSALIWSATGIAEGTAGSTSAMLSVALTDNTDYSWRCRASDAQRDGPWTAMTNFTVHLPQTGITVNIEVEPETLNQKSNGNWVMVEIELPHGYKAESVDISSIRLEGTVPAVLWPYERSKRRHEHGCDNDHREHEHDELKVKFRRSDVIAVLPAGNHVPVHITGTVAGILFEGVDIIRVIR